MSLQKGSSTAMTTTTTTDSPRYSNIPSLACAFSASATTGGTIYAFGIFANDLKQNLQLTQLQLGAVSSAFFIAGLLSWIPGMVVDRMKMRFSMSVGGLSGAMFTMMFWAICRYPDQFSLIKLYPVPILSALAIAISLSCGLIVGSIFKLTLLCGGPDGKGPAVGIAKGFVGLGSGIYATIFQAFRIEGESTLDFLPVIATFFMVCTTIPALLFLPTKQHSSPSLLLMETTKLHFRAMYTVLFVLCFLILGTAIWDVYLADSIHSRDFPVAAPKARQPGRIVMVLVLWLGPIWSLLYLPRKKTAASYCAPSENAPLLAAERSNWKKSESPSSYSDDHLEEGTKKGTVSSASIANVPTVKDLTLFEMLQTPSAWVMLWITLLLVGSGTAKTNNMGQMVESLGFPDSVTPATLAIYSVAQAAARILTGVASEAGLQWKYAVPRWWQGDASCAGNALKTGLPRPFFLLVASLVALIAHIVLASTTQLVTFVVGCTISAIAFGMAWPLMVLIVGDVYGVEYHGANYMFYDGGTKALGTLLLSEYLSGSVYEAHAKTHKGIILCMGQQCFQDTHWATAGLAITCIVASLVLCYQTRQAYFIRT